MEVIRTLFAFLAAVIVALPTIFACIGVYTVGKKLVAFIQTHYVSSTEDDEWPDLSSDHYA